VEQQIIHSLVQDEASCLYLLRGLYDSTRPRTAIIGACDLMRTPGGTNAQYQPLAQYLEIRDASSIICALFSTQFDNAWISERHSTRNLDALDETYIACWSPIRRSAHPSVLPICAQDLTFGVSCSPNTSMMLIYILNRYTS
jgi:hypothetical protein